MERNYAVMIISHGRAENPATYNSLLQNGYTGKIYFVVDDQDKDLEAYKRNFENVLVFSKSEYQGKTDYISNGDITGVPLYARNATMDFAESLGLEYCFMADDDITGFDHRYSDEKGKMCKAHIQDLDSVFEALIDFYGTSDSIATIGGGSASFYIGGTWNKHFKNGIGENLAQFFLYSTKKKFRFKATFEEDFVTRMELNRKGFKCFAIPSIEVVTPSQGTTNGGMFSSYGSIGGVGSAEMYRCRLTSHPYLIRFFKNGKIRNNEHYLSPKILNERHKKQRHPDNPLRADFFILRRQK